jgi:hypothetical protein
MAAQALLENGLNNSQSLDRGPYLRQFSLREVPPAHCRWSLWREAGDKRPDLINGEPCFLRHSHNAELRYHFTVVSALTVNTGGDGEQANSFVITKCRRVQSCTTRDITDSHLQRTTPLT